MQTAEYQFHGSAPQLENIPWWGKNILRREERWGGGKNILNKINSNSEKLREARLLFPLPPLSLSCEPIMESDYLSPIKRNDYVSIIYYITGIK